MQEYRTAAACVTQYRAVCKVLREQPPIVPWHCQLLSQPRVAFVA